MDQGEFSGNYESNAKRQRLHDESDQHENSAAVAAVIAVAAPRQQQNILKLDIDCFDELFDYTGMKDLLSVGNTCKALRNVAGYFFRQNYSQIEIEFYLRGIGIYSDGKYLNVNNLVESVRKIKIFSYIGLQSVVDMKLRLRRLERVEIYDIILTPNDIRATVELWSKVKVLRLYYVKNLQENLPALISHCVNLERLEVTKCDLDFNSIVQKYPTLQCLQLSPDKSQDHKPAPILGKLLTLNSNIQKFATTAKYLWENRDALLNASGIALDELSIKYDHERVFNWYYHHRRNADWSLAELCPLLRQLYDRGVYKRLQFHYESRFMQEDVDHLATVNGLIKLNLPPFDQNVRLFALENLEELRLSANVFGLERISIELVNLKRVHLAQVRLNDVMPFIRRSRVLQKIRVDRLECARIIDLPALNKQRQQLANARKITLYVKEKVYLATKWALGETNFELIKRLESFEWEHDFEQHFSHRRRFVS